LPLLARHWRATIPIGKRKPHRASKAYYLHAIQSPDLPDYRDYLLMQGYHPASVSANLSSVHAAYQRVMRNNHIRERLYTIAAFDLAQLKKVKVK
jgi:site-specific recombinase XerD